MQAFDNYTTLAIVTSLKVDSDGAFADVVTVPERNELTVHIQANYAGPKFGLWLPLAVDDLVVISVCDGNPNSDGVITGRIWSGSEEPPTLAQSDPDHISLTGKEEVRIVLLARKADLRLKTETSGNVQVNAADNINLTLDGSGKVGLGADVANTTDDIVRGTTYRTAEQTLFDAIQAALASVAVSFSGSTDPAVVAAGLTLQTLTNALIGPFAVFKNSQQNYLSTKVRTI